MNKKVLFVWLLLALIVIITATQTIIRAFSGMSSYIPDSLIDGQGYQILLKKQVAGGQNWTFEQWRQSQFEEAEWKLRYINVVVGIMKKLKGQ